MNARVPIEVVIVDRRVASCITADAFKEVQQALGIREDECKRGWAVPAPIVEGTCFLVDKEPIEGGIPGGKPVMRCGDQHYPAKSSRLHLVSSATGVGHRGRFF